MPSFPPKMKALSIFAKNSLKTEIEIFPMVCYFTWKLEFVSNILSGIVVSFLFTTFRNYSVLLVIWMKCASLNKSHTAWKIKRLGHISKTSNIGKPVLIVTYLFYQELLTFAWGQGVLLFPQILSWDYL